MLGVSRASAERDLRCGSAWSEPRRHQERAGGPPHRAEARELLDAIDMRREGNKSWSAPLICACSKVQPFDTYAVFAADDEYYDALVFDDLDSLGIVASVVYARPAASTSQPSSINVMNSMASEK